MMFSIGEFSKITGLTVKTLRFYHEKGVLVPARVEGGSGYRYYDVRNVEAARVIVSLREFGFSLDEIQSMLAEHDDEGDIIGFLKQRKDAISEQIKRERDVVVSINQIIQRESEARQIMEQSTFDIEEKTLEPVIVAGVRMKCRYDEMGKGFSQISRKLGRHISGKCMCLYYDGEYKEEDADLEPCMPVRKQVDADGIDVRELPGGRFVSLMHRGPYGELGRSYERLMTYIKDKGYEMQTPTREVYFKGPGPIFKGNPKKYLTEIQIPVEVGATPIQDETRK